ncbi:hypothetical protein [Bacillus sp. AR18-7]|uniref:hypothetical protein n=1 Tax=Bacillus sp. AR18-7 TaxID=2217821 RepID=UPI0011C81246|nr:hypothetical protein [Bacillus sp. AR18-7]TXR68271.1 hypothetical protein DN395_00035 [Bacillus sp. AR18-7]
MIIDHREWEGTYQMNHDGWVGKLNLFPTSLTLNYTDQNGKVHPGVINYFRQQGQHMRFTIHFPSHRQVFDAYMFSWDKTKIAGITYWKEDSIYASGYGFYANKI